MVYRHEDIDRHHMHIVTIRAKEDGKAICSNNNFYQSKKATRELEKKKPTDGLWDVSILILAGNQARISEFWLEIWWGTIIVVPLQ